MIVAHGYIGEMPVEVMWNGKYYSLVSPAGKNIMESKNTESEEALATITLFDKQQAHVLVGGLGMGYTTAAALKMGHKVDTVELSEDVIKWATQFFGFRPHPNSAILIGDLKKVLVQIHDMYDAILINTDNGSDSLIFDNEWLYGKFGIMAVKVALKQDGRVGYWSLRKDRQLEKRLEEVGAQVDSYEVGEHFITTATWR